VIGLQIMNLMWTHYLYIAVFISVTHTSTTPSFPKQTLRYTK
jgi:hypothetical protein